MVVASYGPPVVGDRCPSPSHAACPACGGKLPYWLSVASSEPTAHAGRQFELCRCLSCGTAVTRGTSDPSLHEAGAYRPGAQRLYALARPILGISDRQRPGLVRQLAPPPARLLDAGAGRGRFVLAAARAGYEASGIEPSARGAESAAAAGARVSQAAIDTACIEPGSVDVVTLWHVLEHLDAPGPALSAIRAWLRPAGGLLVGLPNLASVQARIGGERWYHLDVPRHRVHFTTMGIARLLDRKGFDVLDVRHQLLEHNPYRMWQSWSNRVTSHPSYLYNLLKRNAPAGSTDLALTLALLPLVPAAALVELVAASAGSGTIAGPPEALTARAAPAGSADGPSRARRRR